MRSNLIHRVVKTKAGCFAPQRIPNTFHFSAELYPKSATKELYPKDGGYQMIERMPGSGRFRFESVTKTREIELLDCQEKTYHSV